MYGEPPWDFLLKSVEEGSFLCLLFTNGATTLSLSEEGRMYNL